MSGNWLVRVVLLLHVSFASYLFPGFPEVDTLDGAGELLDVEVQFIHGLTKDQGLEYRIKLEDVAIPVQGPVKRKVIENADADKMLEKVQRAGLNSTRRAPRSAIQQLATSLTTEHDRLLWIERAQVDAIVGACKLSLGSVRSGIRCYMIFAKTVLRKKQLLPPTADDLLAWSASFRCAGTFSNYLSYLKIGCLLEKVSTAAFDDEVVRRAKKAVRKWGTFRPRPKLFIQLEVVEQLIELPLVCPAQFDIRFSMLYLVAYVFLLRLPSEALPITRCDNGRTTDGQQATLYKEGEDLYLKLGRRKNKPWGSLLKRSCWCSTSSRTCPVHVVWPYFEKLDSSQKAFDGITASLALRTLRAYLRAIGIENAPNYRTHDLRRGHAQDLKENGSNLHQILSAGEWRSPAFLQYLNLEELEADAVLEAHIDESSSEDEGD